MTKNYEKINEKYLLKFKQYLRLRRLSKRTIANYLYTINQFLKFIHKNAKKANREDAELFLAKYASDDFAVNTLLIKMNCLKSFYLNVLQSQDLKNLPKPKKEKKLPYVPTRDEIICILKNIKNNKHKCLIGMLYGSGLRLSEVINLKCSDINLENNRVFVRQGKGKKDRFSILSESVKYYLKPLLLNRIPSEYVFFFFFNKKYNPRTVQMILEKAVRNTNINKKITCHSLRHSFATHCLENGVSIIFIQKLLGHVNLKTTMIYLKLSSKSFSYITSPL